MLRTKNPAWADPEKSIGRKSATIKGGKTAWEAKGPAKEVFDEKLWGVIDQLVEANKEDLEAGEKTSHTANFHLWMVGKEPQNARPTVILACRSSTYRTKTLRLLKDKNVLADFPGFALKGMEKMPAESMGQGHKPCSIELDGDVLNREDGVVYLRSGNTTVCGSTILVGDYQEATLGGTLLVDGKYYGFTTLHSQVGRDGSVESLMDPDGELIFDEDSEISSMSTKSLRSKYSTSVLSFHRSSIDYGPTTDEMTFNDKESQASFNAENVSGELKRIGSVLQGSTLSTLDYDIFGIEDSTLRVPNQVLLPRVHGKPQEYLNIETIIPEVVESEVWAVAGKSGVLRGTIMDNPYFIKMAGSKSYQKMWPVELEKNIVPGDCGSWVIDAQSGGLYGHIVAGDSSLHRGYIIPATDVMRDISTRFGHDPILPQHARLVSQSAQTDASESWLEDSRCGTPDNSTADDDFRTVTPIHPQRTENLPKYSTKAQPVRNVPKYTAKAQRAKNNSKHSIKAQRPRKVVPKRSSEVRWYLADCYAKTWNPMFLESHKFENNRFHAEVLRDWNPDGDEFAIFESEMEDSARRYKVEEIIDFCQGARLIDLETGAGIAGQRRGAWCDERISMTSSTQCSMRECNEIMTAAGLYQCLKRPRLPRGRIDGTDQSRRLIYIQNLDPYFILALVHTASSSQFWALRDVMWKYLASQSFIKATISSYPGSFTLEIHISSFVLRAITPEYLEAKNNDFRRRQIDLSFLKTSDQKTYGLSECQFSLIIHGSDNNRWVGYAFEDIHTDDKSLEELVFPCEEVHLDPISSTFLDADLPIWDPREYFLVILRARSELAMKEWEILVRTIEISVRKHQHRHSFGLSEVGNKTMELRLTLDWTQQIVELLSQLLDTLSQTLKEWDLFSSPNGDVGYFCDIEKAASGNRQVGIRSCLRSVKETIERMKELEARLRLLHECCKDSRKDLHIRLALEASEAVRYTSLHIRFTISLILPLVITIAFFSIPQTVTGLPNLEFKYFSGVVVLIIVGMQLLFFCFAALPALPWWWKKLSSHDKGLLRDMEAKLPFLRRMASNRKRSMEVEDLDIGHARV